MLLIKLGFFGEEDNDVTHAYGGHSNMDFF
jgi:hypothetical protein